MKILLEFVVVSDKFFRFYYLVSPVLGQHGEGMVGGRRVQREEGKVTQVTLQTEEKQHPKLSRDGHNHTTRLRGVIVTMGIILG